MENVVINFEANTQGLKEAGKDLSDLGNKAEQASQRGSKGFGILRESIHNTHGSAQLLTGAMGLLGGKTAELETLILKLHSGLQLVRGVSNLTGLSKSLEETADGAKAATTGIKGLTAAISANPVGAALIAITALAAAYYAFKGTTEDATDAIDNMNKQLDLQHDIMDILMRINKEYDEQLQGRVELLKAQGKEGKEVYEAEQSAAAQRIKDIESERVNLQKQHDDNADALTANRKNLELDSKQKEEIAKKLIAEQLDIEKQLNAIPGRRKKAENDLQVVIAQNNTDEVKSTNDKYEKLKKAAEQHAKDVLDALNKFRKLQTESLKDGPAKERAKAFDIFYSDLDVLDERLLGIQKFTQGVEAAKLKLQNSLNKIDDLTPLKPIGLKQQGVIGLKNQTANDAESRLKDLEKQKDIELQIKKELYDGLKDLANDYFKTQADDELRQAEKDRDANQQIIDDKISANDERRKREQISEKEYQDNNKKLLAEKTKGELDAQKKINEAKHKQDLANRASKLFEIALATAKNVIENPGFFPPGGLIPFWLGLGAVQAGLVAAAPLPKYHTGRLASFSQAEELAVVRKDETITNPQKSKEYHPTLSAIHKGAIPANALNGFVKNFRMSDFSGGRSMSGFDYVKNASEIEWQLRGQNKMLRKELQAIRQALQNNSSQSDIRRA